MEGGGSGGGGGGLGSDARANRKGGVCRPRILKKWKPCSTCMSGMNKDISPRLRWLPASFYCAHQQLRNSVECQSK